MKELEIRFLRQGLVKAVEPKGFGDFNYEEKEEWANRELSKLNDDQIIEAMADFDNASQTKEYFDEAPQVAAIETLNGDKIVYSTVEWDAFANREPQLHINISDIDHLKIILDILDKESELERSLKKVIDFVSKK